MKVFEQCTICSVKKLDWLDAIFQQSRALLCPRWCTGAFSSPMPYAHFLLQHSAQPYDTHTCCFHILNIVSLLLENNDYVCLLEELYKLGARLVASTFCIDNDVDTFPYFFPIKSQRERLKRQFTQKSLFCHYLLALIAFCLSKSSDFCPFFVFIQWKW